MKMRSALLIFVLSTVAAYDTALSPSRFHEGQEVRITLTPPSDKPFGSAVTDLDVRIYTRTMTNNGNCMAKTSGEEKPLWTSSAWGKPDMDQKSAAVTFVAPSGTFIICFKHASGDNTWTDFKVGTTEEWTSTVSPYSLTFRYATQGQNALARLVSSGYVSSSDASCYTTSTKEKCTGDMFKFVRSGNPCTPEANTPDDYFGTNKVATSGDWTEDLGSDVTKSFYAGNIGLGVVGTASTNPLVDNLGAGNIGSTGYVYVTIPSVAFDVCYSARSTRASIAGSSMATPVWTKVKGCQITADNDCTGTASFDWTLTAAPERMRWLSPDLTPQTYGTLVFEDPDGNLDTNPSGRGTYYNPTGGDVFKIVGEDKFTGNFPTGCWDNSNSNSMDGSFRPVGSKNLHGDPTHTNSDNDAADQKVAFGDVWIPTSGSKWYVCYRTTKLDTGFRVLPFARPPRDATAQRFALYPSYPQAMKLVPGAYSRYHVNTPNSRWSQTDRRAKTYGALTIEAQQINLERDATPLATGPYDARQSTYWASSARTFGIRYVTGSAVALVPKGRSCFGSSTVVRVTDGGQQECMGANAGTDSTNCAGSASNSASLASVAFYLTVPTEGTYSVCFKHRANNWHMLSTDYVATTRPSLVSETLYTDRVEGMESFFSVHDTSGKNLETGEWKDVFRLVPTDKKCDINPTNYQAGQMAPYLSVYCKKSGYGVLDTECKDASTTHHHFCRGKACDTDTTTLRWLSTNLKSSDPVDDVVPFKYASTASRVAAYVVMPPYRIGQTNTWQMCYRQSKTNMNNWVVLGSISVFRNTNALPGLLSPLPNSGRPLVGGSTQEFRMRGSLTSFRNFEAKFVAYSTWSHCGNPAAGSDANPVESAVTGYYSSTSFKLFVPQTAGRYMLCLKTNTYSWVRRELFYVMDNGIRWFVKPGSEPYNGAAIHVNLRRGACGASCNFESNHEMFNTNPGGDSAKVVPTSSGCETGGHVDLNGALSVTNLGPGDGPADVAEATVTLPVSSRKSTFKVCVKTKINQNGLMVSKWVQVAQALSGLPAGEQVVVREEDHSTPEFVTQVSDVANFDILAGIRAPISHPYSQAVLAGSGSTYVQSNAVVNGFRFNPQSGKTLATTHEFKLVQKSTFDGRWGDNHNEVLLEANCFNQSVETATNIVPCTDGNLPGSCPKLEKGESQSYVTGVFQFPVDPASYIVCYRTAAAKPWVQLSSTGGTRVWAVPSMLEMESLSTNALSIFDRSMTADYKDIPSWCSDSTRGANHGCGTAKDYVTVVAAARVCVPPATSSDAVEAKGWYPLKEVNPRTVTVDSTTFALPTTSNSAYKICVYKSGSKYRLQKGIVYQLYNRKTMDGYYRIGTTVPSLSVSTTLASAHRFVQWTSNMQSQYSNKDPELLKIDGSVYRSPAIRSGEVVEFEVLLTGFANEVVTVEQCETPTSWSDLTCQKVATTSPLVIRNVHTTCNYQASEGYDWGKGGLSQHALGGRVQFRLQVLSRCASTNGFGCGIRFVVGDVKSAPQWFNVLPHYPDAVALNGNYVNSKASTSYCSANNVNCDKFTCRMGTDCTINIQARYGGPDEYSATGEVSASVITTASPELSRFVEAWKTTQALSWDSTGHAKLQLAAEDIALKSSYNEGTVKMRLTYGESGKTTWTEFAIRVVRPRPRSVRIVSIVPMDKQFTQSRTPTPAFIPTSPNEPLMEMLNTQRSSSNTVVAAQDSYIESLMPYELRYTVFDDDGKPMTEDGSLGDWKVTASFSSHLRSRSATSLASSNKIMRVLMDGDVPSPMNLWTTEESEIDFAEVPIAKDNGWVQHFRVRNNNGCTRFSPCTITFMWRRGSDKMQASVRTPVRVVGSTTRVMSAIRTPGGVRVTVAVGTPSGNEWFADEFHHGHAFALFADSSSADGTTNEQHALMTHDDGGKCMYTDSCPNSCKVYGYPFRRVGSYWAATWELNTDRTCTSCKFTFHSDMGASPYVYGGKEHGFATYSFTHASPVLCPGYTTAACMKDSPKCEEFDLTIRLRTPETVTCDAPKWKVFLDSDVRVAQTVNGKYSLDYNFDSQTTTMQMNSTATFKDLVFKLDAGSPQMTSASTINNARERRIIRIHAQRYLYGRPGYHNPVATENYMCDVTVGLYYKPPPPSTKWVEITGITGATSMCGGETTTTCTNWYTTTSQLKTGLTISTQYKKTQYSAGVVQEVADDDVSDRQFAIIPKGGFRTVSKGSILSVPGGTGRRIATLGSNREPLRYYTDAKGNRWSWGYAEVEFSGDAHGSAGSLSMKYTSAAREVPASELVFSVCWMKGSTLSVTQCKDIKLWVIQETPAVQLAITSESAQTKLTAGTCMAEGVDGVTVKAMAYSLRDNNEGNVLFYYANTPLKYSLTFTGQQFITGTTTPAASEVTVSNQVSASLSLIQRLEASTTQSSLEVSLTAYGVNPVAEGTIQIAAASLDSSVTSPTFISTTTKYTFEKAEADIKRWMLLNHVIHGNTCPNAEARLPYHNKYYRAYYEGVTPGQGWAYAGGAMVGVPVPIQTLVVGNSGHRAYTFESRKVRVSRAKPFIGCNDGKDIKVYNLKQPTGADPVPHDGSMSSWEVAQGNAVSTDRGLATPWIVFNEPAERVVLQLDLCYDNSDLQQCLTSPTSAESDAAPAFGDRTKFTKPFTVQKRKTTHLQVTSQDVPNNGEVQVGKSMNVKLEAVTRIGERQWTVVDSSQRPDKLLVSSSYDWSSDGLKYGNGGFMKATAARGGCEVPLTAADLAASSGFVPFDASKMELTFYFARPCASCKINVHYMMHDTLTTFQLRTWQQIKSVPSIGEVLVMKATTCGKKWILGGVPPVAVHTRRPFSLTALRVDNNNFPSWDSTDVVDITKLLGVGNGMGGTMTQSSPEAKAVEGAANARVAFSRPCFTCKLKFAVEHKLTVLTDAQTVDLLPTAHTMVQHKVMENSNSVASWDLDAFWADNRGYRAFENGPSQLSMKPRYTQMANKLQKMEIGRFNVADYTNRVEGFSLITGSANIHLANATHMVNGIPFQLGMLGRFTFRMTRPAIDYKVKLESLTSMQTARYLGKDSGFSVDFTVPATHMAVDRNTAVGCSTRYANSGCTFKVYAIGQVPGPASDTYYLSTARFNESATTTYSCQSNCATLSITEGAFTRGIAQITAKATEVKSSACNCNITVKPPAALASATDQIFTMEFNVKDPRPVVAWSASSPDIYSTGSSSTKRSISLHEVTITLAPIAADGAYSDAALNSQINVVTVRDSSMSPSGCFVCSEINSLPSEELGREATVLATRQCKVTMNSAGYVTLKGHFKSTGTCILNGGTISGLPISSSATKVALTVQQRVTVESTKGVRVNEYSGIRGSKSPFAHLSTVTRDGQGEADGKPAAVEAVGTTMTFTMIDSNENLVLGDYHSKATIEVTRDGNKVGETLTATANRGVIRVPFNPPASTHWESTHKPYTFKLTVKTDFVGSTTDTELTQQTLGPLYVVKTGINLRASISDAGANTWVPYTPEMHWMVKRPFDLKIEMLDRDGSLVSHAGDYGGDALVTMQPVAIPCLNVDVAPGYLTTTCIEGIGTCRKEPEVPCTDGWRKGSNDNTGVVQDRDMQMASGVAIFAGLQWTQAEGVQGLWIHAEAKEYHLHDMSLLLHFDMQRPVSLVLAPVAATREVSDTFAVSGTMKDQWGDRIEAEDYTQFSIAVKCEDTGKDIFFQRKEKNATGHEVLVLANRVTSTATNGDVSFSNLYFSNVCNVTKVAVTPLAYTAALPTTVKAVTTVFKVQNTNNATVVEPSSFTPKLSLGLGDFPTIESAVAFMKMVWIAELVNAGFTQNMLNVMKRNVQAATGVRLLHLCAIPAGRASHGITNVDRKGTATDGAKCLDRTEALNSANPSRKATVLADGFVCLSEFQVQMGADKDNVENLLHDALKADLASSSSSLRASKPDIFQNATSGLSILYTPEPTSALAPEFGASSIVSPSGVVCLVLLLCLLL